MCGRRDDSLLFDDLITATERLIEIGASVPPGHLGDSRAVQEMVQWNLLVIGEATKRLDQAIRERFTDVPWSAMARTRDRVIHHYEGTQWWLIEEIIAVELPALLPRLIEIRDLVRAEFDTAEDDT